MAAAMPPSAITVWALPSKLLQITAVLAPASWAATAARRPAPPAPMMMTSYECRSNSLMTRALQSEETGIGDPTGRDQPDVEVGQGHKDQAGPGEEHVPGVELGNHAPRLEA